MPAAPARAALADLTAPDAPYLIGVRHHSPALAAAVPALLTAADPQVLLVELPAEMQPWLRWLADPATTAPVALAAVPSRTAATGGGPGTAFYPFAEFSPEFAAVRWAAAAGVPVVACDLPLADRAWTTDTAAPAAPRAAGPGSLWQALRDGVTGRAGDDLWDRLVEAAAPGSAPEAVRRAALLAGWALRQDAGTAVPATDLARERHMRGCLAAARAGGRRVAAVIGAFHAPALSAAPDAEGEAAPATDPTVPATDPTEPAGARPWPHPDAVVRAALHEHGGDGDDHLPGRAPGHDPTAGHAAPTEATPDGAWSISLIPYTYALLDERSGYPAGIRDPEWQHHVLTAGGDPAAVADALTTTAVRITAALRGAGHPSGPADAREITRLAGDLARLRNLPAPGRGELAEAVQTVLAQGELHGRGRAVARALDEVLVGSRTGAVSPRAPRGGLGPSVERELVELGLPGPHDTARQSRDLRLDPLRSDLDRRRELLLRRLAVCGVPYGEPREVAGTGGGDALTSRWEIRWTPATAAVLTAATVRGVTAAQAAEGVLRERHRAEQDEGGPTAAQILTGLADAADCGVVVLADERLTETADLLPGCATLPELLAALSLVDRVGSGHIPGLPADTERADRAAATAAALTAAGVRQLDGLAGSDDTDDARALVELAHRADISGGIRLADALTRLAADGSPLMRGAAGAALVLLGQEEPAVLGERAAAWLDAATDPERRAALTARLTGLLTAAGPLLEAVPHTLDPLLGRVTDLPDRDFLDRLPALRGGFDTLSPAARDRLLTVVEERLGTALPDAPTDPATLAANARADLAARTVLEQLGLLPPPSPATGTAGTVLDGPPATADAAATAGTAPAAETCPTAEPGAAPAPPAEPPGAATPPAGPTDETHRDLVPPAAPAPPRLLAAADRWRLVLGRRHDALDTAAAGYATALDELYGRGSGEGSRGDLGGGTGGGGGREAPYPGVRAWSEELAALFGPGIREEVMAAAAAQGRTDVLTELHPDTVRPSVDLLRTVLSHAGGLPEARLAALRPLVRRLVDELTKALATRVRPALHGAIQPRPSHRPGGPLDLPRTIRANLAGARRRPDGTVQLLPEHPVFHSRGRRSADWRLILVTDVSGSMESSTIWAALTASVLAGVPTLSTHFLAFSTEVVDLTGQVDDPLSLLLEVSIGGGTHIAAGLRAARELVSVPSRTLVVVISDFEEGHPLGGLLAEVRALVAAGCHVLGCAGLDDLGRPRYSTGVAAQLVAAGMPVAALSPQELARWVGEKVS